MGRRQVLRLQVTDVDRLDAAIVQALERWPAAQGNTDEAFALAELRLELAAAKTRREALGLAPRGRDAALPGDRDVP